MLIDNDKKFYHSGFGIGYYYKKLEPFLKRKARPVYVFSSHFSVFP